MIERSLLADRFELLELIDQGGVGAVYRGRDVTTGQPVAIKALKPDIITLEPTLIDRFKREAEALRQLNHPNIIKIIDTIVQDGRYYIVMDFIPGGSLEKLIQQEKHLSVERTLQIALDIADALTRAHRLKIIHRDIKPANVLLDEYLSPRLTDFGVAQVGDEQTRLTAIGSLVGTIAYLSPEVARGEPYDERSDIWSFGVMLYEMLTGKNPFAEGNVQTTLTAIRVKVPADVTDTRPDVPPELAYLIDRMIAKDPLDRLNSVRSVGAELESILAQVNRMKKAATEPPASNDPVDNTTLHVPPENESPTEPAEPEMRRESDPMPAVPPAPSKPTSPLGRMILDDRLAAEPSPRRRTGQPRVFVAYRREDTGEIARKIYDVFQHELGDTDVARDVDRVANKTINRVVLAQDIVASFDAMVVVIGNQFIGLPKTSVSGKPQTLHNPKDPVRIQVEAGLKREDMLIIPVLVDGAELPKAEDLPPSLQKIALLTPFRIQWTAEQGDAAFEAQMKKLIRQIRQAFNPTGRRWLLPAIAIGVLIIVVLLIVLTSLGNNTPAIIVP